MRLGKVIWTYISGPDQASNGFSIEGKTKPGLEVSFGRSAGRHNELYFRIRDGESGGTALSFSLPRRDTDEQTWEPAHKLLCAFSELARQEFYKNANIDVERRDAEARRKLL